MMQSYYEIMSQRREQEAILLQDEEKQELLAEEHAASPSEPSPVSYFYNADYDSISTPSYTYTTIPETESDELIKSSVENLVPTPSESVRDLSIGFIDIENTLIISSPKFDSLLEEFSGELAHINLIPPGINEADFDPEEEIRLVEKLFNSENSDAIIKSFSSSPIPVEDRDILFLEELLSNDSPSLPENESFHFDVPSSPQLYVHVPNVLPNLPTPSPMFDTLLPFSSKNDDKVFNLGSLSSNEEKSPHLLSHRGFNPSKIISGFSESPMMIHGEDIPILDVLIAPDYKASCARGFVFRSLELQSLA
ncbi:hypothetical protein Tco_0930998 [Tanacetum coccineum]